MHAVWLIHVLYKQWAGAAQTVLRHYYGVLGTLGPHHVPTTMW